MKSIIRLLLIICGLGTNLFTMCLLIGTLNPVIIFLLVASNTLALTWAVVLREVFGWDKYRSKK